MSLPPETRFSVAVSDAERLDSFLANQLQMSRTVAARIVADKRVIVAGQPARASFKPEYRTEIAISFPDQPVRQVTANDIPLTIAWEDEALAVIDKPAGLVVHPAPGHWDDTLVNALVARGFHLAGGEEGRLGIVHRLDKDTSGLIVVAKTARAHEKLGSALAARKVTRRYAALAWGHLGAGERKIDAALARHEHDRKRIVVSAERGRQAVTRVQTVARGDAAELVRCTLETGRTHQIRVHLQSIGHSVVGDTVYAGGQMTRADRSWQIAEALNKATPRQALHAAWLRLPHPLTGETLDVRSEWPEDLRAALALAIPDPALLAETKPLQYLGFFASTEPT